MSTQPKPVVVDVDVEVDIDVDGVVGAVEGIEWGRANGTVDNRGDRGDSSRHYPAADRVVAQVIPIANGRGGHGYMNGHGHSRPRTKASFSDSPLARPSTPIHRLASAFQSWLHLPDPGPLYAVVGALVANSMRGYPVWLMTVGPPSCGKTVLLNSLLGLDRVRVVNDVSGKAAFLSGVKEKDKLDGADGGLLNEIGSRGCLVIPDYTTTILSLEPKEAKAIVGVLREVYDGSWGRDVGTDGHKHMSWTGRIGILAGCTDAIDDHPALSTDLGERFIQYRYGDSTGWAETNRAMGNPDPDTTRRAMGEAVDQFAAEVDFDWEESYDPVAMGRADIERLIALAQFTAAGRGMVKRDWKTREIVNVPRPELAPRIAGQLAQLVRGMERIGVTDTERWGVVCQIALDCMSRNRATGFRAAMAGKGSAAEVAGILGVSLSEGRRTMEDLGSHRLLEKCAGEGKWQVSGWARERLEIGWKGVGVG